jgi:hypothetical protein
MNPNNPSCRTVAPGSGTIARIGFCWTALSPTCGLAVCYNEATVKVAHDHEEVMIAQTVEAEIREQLSQLPVEQQRRVLEFARSLVAARVRGVPGKTLLRFAGAINTDDLTAMKQAIEEGCEQVSLNDW